MDFAGASIQKLVFLHEAKYLECQVKKEFGFGSYEQLKREFRMESLH